MKAFILTGSGIGALKMVSLARQLQLKTEEKGY